MEFILPTDVIIADKFAEDANDKVVAVDDIPDGWMVPPAPRLKLCSNWFDGRCNTSELILSMMCTRTDTVCSPCHPSR